MNVEKLEQEWKEVRERFFNGPQKLLLNGEDEDKREILEKSIYWLSKIYVKAPWKKICLSKQVTRENVFDHNIRYAGACPTIQKVNDRLCQGLSIQYIAIYPRLLEELDMKRDLILDYLRKSPMYLSLKAMELGDWIFKNIYTTNKGENENDESHGEETL
jgi:hypothetical protein